MSSASVRLLFLRSALLGFLAACDGRVTRDARAPLDAPREVGAVGSCGARPCTLAFRHLHRLGSFEGEDAIETPLRSVAGRPDGEVIVGSVATPPYHFSAGGAYLGRIGGMGEGPGELKSVSLALSGPGDSLIVVDGGLMRLTVFSRCGRAAGRAHRDQWSGGRHQGRQLHFRGGTGNASDGL